MADISKCSGTDCDRKAQCYRFTAEDSPRQAYSNFWDSPKPCEWFAPNGKQRAHSKTEYKRLKAMGADVLPPTDAD